MFAVIETRTLHPRSKYSSLAVQPRSDHSSGEWSTSIIRCPICRRMILNYVDAVSQKLPPPRRHYAVRRIIGASEGTVSSEFSPIPARPSLTSLTKPERIREGSVKEKEWYLPEQSKRCWRKPGREAVGGDKDKDWETWTGSMIEVMEVTVTCMPHAKWAWTFPAVAQRLLCPHPPLFLQPPPSPPLCAYTLPPARSHPPCVSPSLLLPPSPSRPPMVRSTRPWTPQRVEQCHTAAISIIAPSGSEYW